MLKFWLKKCALYVGIYSRNIDLTVILEHVPLIREMTCLSELNHLPDKNSYSNAGV